MSQSPPAKQSDSASRDANGRFAQGNAGGPGNPFARQVAQLRAALVNAVTVDDIRQIAKDLLTQAKLGNLPAARLLLQYVLGKPAPAVNPDTLDVEEWRQVYGPVGQIKKELPEVMMALPAEMASDMARVMQPFVRDKLGELLALPQDQYEEALRQRDRLRRAQQPPAYDFPDMATPYLTERPRAKKAAPPAGGAAASPSTNGGGGQKKAVAPSSKGEGGPKARPSTNGGGKRPLPAWLGKVAAHARVAAAEAGKGHRRKAAGRA